MVTMPHVVTCLLVHNGKLLLLKRSNRVRTYKGQWGGVAGYIEPGETPLETAYKEIKEEAGFTQDEVLLLTEAKPVAFKDTYRGETYDWVVHPYVFEVEKKEKLDIDW